uniref:Uncharacterized protein n=1 Tax=Anguilla anguilla TaxID=7936 RepID=A0A0E9WFF3_ANGAN
MFELLFFLFTFVLYILTFILYFVLVSLPVHCLLGDVVFLNITVKWNPA